MSLKACHQPACSHSCSHRSQSCHGYSAVLRRDGTMEPWVTAAGALRREMATWGESWCHRGCARPCATRCPSSGTGTRGPAQHVPCRGVLAVPSPSLGGALRWQLLEGGSERWPPAVLGNKELLNNLSLSHFLHPAPWLSRFMCAEHPRLPPPTLSQCLQQRHWWPNRGSWEDCRVLTGTTASSTPAPGNVPVLGSFTRLVISCKTGTGKGTSAPSRHAPALHTRCRRAACGRGRSRRCSQPAARG